MQQHLILYQIETVPVPIIDQNETGTLLHTPTDRQAIHSFKLRNIHCNLGSKN